MRDLRHTDMIGPGAFLYFGYDAQGRVTCIGRSKGACYRQGVLKPEQNMALWEVFKIPETQCCVPREPVPQPQSWDQIAREKAERLGITPEQVQELWKARRDANKRGDRAAAQAITAQLTPPKPPAPSRTIAFNPNAPRLPELTGELAKVAEFIAMRDAPKYAEKIKRMRLEQIELNKKWEAQAREIVADLRAAGASKDQISTLVNGVVAGVRRSLG